MDGNQNVEALFQRAFVLNELGRHNDALQDLRKVRQLSQYSIQKADILFHCGITS